MINLGKDLIKKRRLQDDTCSFELTTTYEDNLGSYGIMFDVQLYERAISLFGFDFYTDVTHAVSYELYTKPNSFRDDDGKTNISAWSLLKKGTVKGAGLGVGTPIREFVTGNLTVGAYDKISLYITLATTDLRYRDIRKEMPNAVVGDMFVQNEDLEIQVGSSVAGPALDDPITALFGKRALCGTLHYDVARPCPSEVPSGAPSTASSLSPSTTGPTMSPSIPPSLSTMRPTQAPSFASPLPTMLPTTPGATEKPSAVFSMEPSSGDSFEPSVSESHKPSYTPSSGEQPTVSPTVLPSSILPEPTYSPSFLNETFSPSIELLKLPTNDPTSTPSIDPTVAISSAPSIITMPPSITMTLFPTRENKDDWKCEKNDAVETTFEGGTGAYGNIFSVTSKDKPVHIKTLSFHTDYADGNVTALVYTKMGDFVGFENTPKAWRKVAESTLRGAGSGFPTTIPTDDFEMVTMIPNETVSFYITLTTADIRYTRTNVTLGQPIASNDYINVNAGVGLADFPFASEFFLYSPRSFNGLVHLSTEAECLPSLNVTYSLRVQHQEDLSNAELYRLIATNLEAKSRRLLHSRPELEKFVNASKVSVDSAYARGAKGSCKALNFKVVCSPVEATVVIKHAQSLRPGKLRFQWLNQYLDITESINLQFLTQYVGDVPVTSGITLSLNANTVVEDMPPAVQDNFELGLIDFLSGSMASKNVTILDVNIGKIAFHKLDNATNGRFLQRGDDDISSGKPAMTIDVTPSVNGQYRPPPDIDFSAVVEDAVDADPQQLEESMRRKDTYFEILNSIDAKPGSTTSDSASELEPPSAPKSSNSLLLILFLCCIMAIILIVGGTIYYRRKKRKREKLSNLFVEESELLKKPKKVFGFVSKYNNQLDGVLTAEVAWTTNDDGQDQASFEKPQSLYEMRQVASYKDDPYNANLVGKFKEKGFQNDDPNLGTYGSGTDSYAHLQRQPPPNDDPLSGSYGSGMDSYAYVQRQPPNDDPLSGSYGSGMDSYAFVQRAPTTSFNPGYRETISPERQSFYQEKTNIPTATGYDKSGDMGQQADLKDERVNRPDHQDGQQGYIDYHQSTQQGYHDDGHGAQQVYQDSPGGQYNPVPVTSAYNVGFDETAQFNMSLRSGADMYSVAGADSVAGVGAGWAKG